MIAKYIFVLLSALLAGCSSYTELSYNCTGYLKERTIIPGRVMTQSNPKVVGIYVTESTKTLFNFWKDKTHSVSVGNMLFTANQSAILDYAIMGRIEEKEDSFGNLVSKAFVLDRHTNILTTNLTKTRPGNEMTESFEGVCNPVKQ